MHNIQYNRSRAVHSFPFKTDGIARFPNGPADSCNAQGVKLSPSRQPTLTPFLTLVKRLGNVASTDSIGDDCPHSFCCGTLKEQVLNVLVNATEIASRGSGPSSFDHVVFWLESHYS